MCVGNANRSLTDLHLPSLLVNSQMEVSPKSDTDNVLMTRFAQRILGGLQADKSISTEDYISDIKRELKKVMKQRYAVINTYVV